MEIIARQGERAQVLISDLLDLSKFEHATPVELEPVWLRAAVRDAIEAAPAPAGRSVVVDIDDDVRVLADRSRLERILINLLTNAYRYGGDTVSLKAQVTGTEVDVVVADNGPGVSPDLVPHLFEPFCRARAGGMEGSGLGLAIIRALVGGMGGAVWYEAGPEGGAQFAFRLAPG
jgi:signal transduction histidine kinase